MPGIFGIDSTSSSTDNRIGATGTARVVRGNSNQYTESGSISVGAHGTYVEAGGLNLANAKNTTITVNDTGGDTAVALNKSWMDTLGLIEAKNADTTQSAISQTTGAFKDLLAKLTDTSQAQLTGASPRLLLWLGLGLLGLVGAIFYFRK
jgi:flagellar basal body rod protein FlgG